MRSHSLSHSDELSSKLSQNPPHMERFFTLEHLAKAALLDGKELGPVRKQIDEFQEAMTRMYGRRLELKDVAAATLRSSSRRVMAQYAAFRGIVQECDQVQQINEAIGAEETVHSAAVRV